jgi:hypothetical protein
MCPREDDSFEHSTKRSVRDRWGSDWTFCFLIALLSKSKLHCYSNELHDSTELFRSKKSYGKCIQRYRRVHPQAVPVVVCIEACQLLTANGISWWQKQTIQEECFNCRKSVKSLEISPCKSLRRLAQESGDRPVLLSDPQMSFVQENSHCISLNY